jgi:hypothetical protein
VGNSKVYDTLTNIRITGRSCWSAIAPDVAEGYLRWRGRYRPYAIAPTERPSGTDPAVWTDAVAGADTKTYAARAFGADYIANILRQQQAPRRPQPPTTSFDAGSSHWCGTTGVRGHREWV